MGRTPFSKRIIDEDNDNNTMGVKKGPWSSEEDQKLISYIRRYGIWNWSHMPKPAGLARSGKSCRLRWMNYLRPNIKHGNFTEEEEETIIKWHQSLGNRWSAISKRLPGRTDNEIKNYWNTRLKKRVMRSEKPLEAPSSDRISSQLVAVSPPQNTMFAMIDCPSILESLSHEAMSMGSGASTPKTSDLEETSSDDYSPTIDWIDNSQVPDSDDVRSLLAGGVKEEELDFWGKMLQSPLELQDFAAMFMDSSMYSHPESMAYDYSVYDNLWECC